MAIKKQRNHRLLEESLKNVRSFRKLAYTIKENFGNVTAGGPDEKLASIIENTFMAIIDNATPADEIFAQDIIDNMVDVNPWILEEYDMAEIEATIKVVANWLENEGKLDDVIFIED